jgi:hypothetical protein
MSLVVCRDVKASAIRAEERLRGMALGQLGPHGAHPLSRWGWTNLTFSVQPGNPHSSFVLVCSREEGQEKIRIKCRDKTEGD